MNTGQSTNRDYSEYRGAAQRLAPVANVSPPAVFVNAREKRADMAATAG